MANYDEHNNPGRIKSISLISPILLINVDYSTVCCGKSQGTICCMWFFREILFIKQSLGCFLLSAFLREVKTKLLCWFRPVWGGLLVFVNSGSGWGWTKIYFLDECLRFFQHGIAFLLTVDFINYSNMTQHYCIYKLIHRNENHPIKHDIIYFCITHSEKMLLVVKKEMLARLNAVCIKM